MECNRYGAHGDPPLVWNEGWATPIIVEHAGKAQVIVSGTNRVRV